MNIRCGHCEERHATVQEIKECGWGIAEQEAIADADYRIELAQERAIERSHEWAAS